MSNFTFLKDEFEPFWVHAVEAEKEAYAKPRTSAFYARFTLEAAVKYLYRVDRKFQQPYQDNLSSLLYEQSFQDNIGRGLVDRLHYIRKLGNHAAHPGRKISAKESLAALQHLFMFLQWLVSVYARNKQNRLVFDVSVIPKADPSTTLRDQESKRTPSGVNRSPSEVEGELENLKAVIEARSKQVEERFLKLAQKEGELKQIQDEIESIKQKNSEREYIPDDPNEDQTRSLIIDLLLKEAGWDISTKDATEFEVKGMPSDSGIGFVDYVLWGDNGLPLAVVEAKRAKKDANAGKQQAKLYADCLEQMYEQRPIIYYTNGYETRIWDDLNYNPRKVQGFHSKAELQTLINRRASKQSLKDYQVNKAIAGRYYQEEAIKRVGEVFESKRRHALLVMATGSGKTRTATEIVNMAIKQGWVKRVLFLADRRELVKQAKKSFTEHLPRLSMTNLLKEKEDEQSRIIFSTYPTMLNFIDEVKENDEKRFGIGHFDLIIIDEAHRSVYFKYRAIFEYFDSLMLGLTATPKSEIDHNTYELFELDDGMPTYSYELEKGVSDGFLVPPQIWSVPLKFQREGIKYDDLSKEDQADYENQFYEVDTGLFPEEIKPSALNSWLFNDDTVDKVLETLFRQGQKVEGGDRLGKTIIFAKNQKHAELIIKRFERNYRELIGGFARQIDNSIKYVDDLVDQFKDEKEWNKYPIIAVSVDMLDTGVDIPHLLNLVFFKPVKSKAKFFQMIGRGTRLCPDLFGPDMHKTHFTILDFCENFEYFGEQYEEVKGTESKNLSGKIFDKRVNMAFLLQTKFDDQKHNVLRHSLITEMHEAVSVLNVDSALVRPKREYVEKYSQLDKWQNLNKNSVSEIKQNLATLPFESDVHEHGRRFDLLCYNLMESWVYKKNNFIKYQHQISEVAKSLLSKKSVQAVADEMEFIKEIQEDKYWDKAELNDFEVIRTKLRVLIKSLDPVEKKFVYTAYEDELGESTEVEGFIKGDVGLAAYRKKVSRYIEEHQDNITIQKLKKNKPITKSDMQTLEEILVTDCEFESLEELQKVLGEQRLAIFIRSLVGLDANTAKEAFSEFLTNDNYAPNQISFINQIIDYLIKNGTIEPGVLYESPFTENSPNGLDGIFNDSDADKIVSIVSAINHTTDVA